MRDTNPHHQFVTIDRGAQLTNSGWREYDRICQTYDTKTEADRSDEVRLLGARVKRIAFARRQGLFS